MNLKIKTKDIELDYKDEYSIIEEDAKKRILELLDSVYQKQKDLEQQQTNLNSRAIGPFSTSDLSKEVLGKIDMKDMNTWVEIDKIKSYKTDISFRDIDTIITEQKSQIILLFKEIESIKIEIQKINNELVKLKK